MTTAIMQPYLFPYIGYWQLINAVDTLVIYDNIQFSKSGWYVRNNIILNGKKTLFSVPLRKDSDYLDVKDRFISENASDIINKILAQIRNGYQRAPYFNNVYPIIEKAFLFEDKNVFNYIYNSIIMVCEYLEINTNIVISSNVDINHSLKSQDKVIAINKAMNEKVYINPIGGEGLYNKDDFFKEKIQLFFLKPNLSEYIQFKNKFIPYLSVIDIMMFNSVDEIKIMLSNFELR
jgi:hypothetical protein